MELDLRPNEQELARINQLCPQPQTAEQCSVIPVLIFDQALTAYYTRADESWLRRAEANINGAEGVSFMKHHDKTKDPVGRVFEAAVGTNDTGMSLNGKVVVFDADLAEKYKNGTFKAVSASVASSWLKCSVCGNEWLSHACIKDANKNEETWHWPGEEFRGEKCFLWHMADQDDEHAGMVELSAVYKGASRGKMLMPGEVSEMFRDFTLSFDRDGANAETLKEEFISQAKNKFKTMSFEFPVVLETEGGEPDMEALTAERDALTTERDTLTTERDALTADLAARDATVTELTKQVADLSAARSTLQGQIDEFKQTLKSRRDLNAEMRKILDDIKCALPDPAIIETDEALASAACACIALGIALRTDIAVRIEKADIQLNGEKAEKAETHARSMSAVELVGKLEVMQKAVAAKYGIDPVTGAVADVPLLAKKPAQHPSSVYKD